MTTFFFAIDANSLQANDLLENHGRRSVCGLLYPPAAHPVPDTVNTSIEVFAVIVTGTPAHAGRKEPIKTTVLHKRTA
jgi:hypothetical protein